MTSFMDDPTLLRLQSSAVGEIVVSDQSKLKSNLFYIPELIL